VSGLDQLGLAESHLDALEFLIPKVSEHHRWVTTVAFYCALKAVDQVLEDSNPGWSPASHSERHRALNRQTQFKKVQRHYNVLYRQSKDARYEIHGTNVPKSETLRQIVRKELIPTLNACSTHLKPAAVARIESMVARIDAATS
jgi:bisphosphoglycerate-independent phosphoglycerate mutase (AlkP superfamily)